MIRLNVSISCGEGWMVISGYEIEGKMTDWSKYRSLGKENWLSF